MDLNKINIVTFALDDDKLILKIIGESLKMEGIHYQVFTDIDKFLSSLHDDVHICIIDYELKQSRNGRDVMEAVLNINPNCFCIILSSQVNYEVVVDLLNAGCFRYVDKGKPNYLNKLIEFVRLATETIKREIGFYTELLERFNSTKQTLENAVNTTSRNKAIDPGS